MQQPAIKVIFCPTGKHKDSVPSATSNTQTGEWTCHSCGATNRKAALSFND